MTQAAVAAAKAVGYTNAGTIEFLVSGEEFYFLEMNTRLQVEHPVTEAITGIDLVRAQLIVAAGDHLPFRQDDLTVRGHAVECRVYAEDPAMEFLPQAGPLLRYREPQGPGIRVDAGVREGQDISVHYDPMIAKVITLGESREAAWARASLALRGFDILGLTHNISFLLALLKHPDVWACRTHTRFIEEHLAEFVTPASDAVLHVQAALAAVLATSGLSHTSTGSDRGAAGVGVDPWTSVGTVDW
jgi:acetyl/propionyl-CoA carboxylase alpha subunit